MFFVLSTTKHKEHKTDCLEKETEIQKDKVESKTKQSTTKHKEHKTDCLEKESEIQKDKVDNLFYVLCVSLLIVWLLVLLCPFEFQFLSLNNLFYVLCVSLLIVWLLVNNQQRNTKNIKQIV
jgi:Flp pilus assembly protein TadB